jgi:hypothetical protein
VVTGVEITHEIGHILELNDYHYWNCCSQFFGTTWTNDPPTEFEKGMLMYHCGLDSFGVGAVKYPRTNKGYLLPDQADKFQNK